MPVVQSNSVPCNVGLCGEVRPLPRLRWVVNQKVLPHALCTGNASVPPINSAGPSGDGQLPKTSSTVLPRSIEVADSVQMARTVYCCGRSFDPTPGHPDRTTTSHPRQTICARTWITPLSGNLMALGGVSSKQMPDLASSGDITLAGKAHLASPNSVGSFLWPHRRVHGDDGLGAM